MHVPGSWMIASVAVTICGSGRSSTRTSPGACMTATRTIVSLHLGVVKPSNSKT
jgi:hypothetical protein